MQVNIGEKIRELRRRDGRTQEALADALGVTGQAVSRWEANGGYPDMEIIPSIANYFHVTIDELFGYDNDREIKLQTVLDKADAYLNAQDDMEPCVKLLRETISEFPTETRLFIRLAYALIQLGWQKYGARGMTTDGCDYTQENIAYNSKNEYWQEAVSLFEKYLKLDISPDDRIAATMITVSTYASMGENEKAKIIANEQGSVVNCREYLLSSATSGEERDKYQGEAVIALLKKLKSTINMSVMTKLSLCRSKVGVDILLGLARLYEVVFGDGNCGYAHGDLCELYITSAIFTARNGDLDTALDYFDNAFENYRKYNALKEQKEYRYTAPLVSKVTAASGHWTSCMSGSFEGWLGTAPDNLINAIKADDKYAECFE